MSTVPPLSDADWAARLAAAEARCARAEAALDTAQAQLAALEQQLASTATSAQRHHTQLTALVHNLRVGLVLVDHEAQIQFVNQHFWELFGLLPVKEGEPIAQADVLIAESFLDPAVFRARAWAMYEAGETVVQEEFVLADGRVLELDYLVLDEVRAGRLICYRDVTERYQRDAQLRTMAFIPEQNPNPTLRVLPTGELTYANPAARPLLQALAARGGWPPSLLSLVDAALRTLVLHQQELALAGQHYMCAAVAVPDQAYVTLYLTDITARQQAEVQLAEQRLFYESVLEQVPAGVAVFDAGHRYLFLNTTVEPDPATRAWMLGKTSDECFRHRQRPPGVAQQRREAFAAAVREQQEVTWEELRSGATGDRHLLMRLKPVTGPNGELRVISSGIDITERRQAEEKAVQQQEFYESILNLLPVDVAVFDAEHRFLFANPSSISDPVVRQRIIGMTSAEYFAERQQHQPAGTAAQREQYFDLAVRTRTDVSWEEMRTDAKQRPKLVLRHLRPIFGPAGYLRLVVGSGIDITARYTAEKLQHQVQVLLQEQQAFIRQIVDTLPNVVYVVEPNGSISFSNKAFQEASAHSQHNQVEDFNPVVQDERLQVKSLNQQVQATRQAVTVEQPFTLLSGETVYYQVHKRPMLRADGQVGILTISTDITAVKQARQELERREKQYRDLVYYSQALICTHDLHGTLLSVNPAIEQLMGAPAAQLVGRQLSEALPPEHHAPLQAYLKGAMPRKAQARVITVRNGLGEKRYLQYYTYQVSEEGYPPYVVASGYDVTEGVLAQRALQQAKQKADENAQAKEDFLARMSHEIRTPLNGVLGMAALLQKTDLTASQREYLYTMQHAGRHLLALLNDVLDMAKITTHNLQLDHAPFDLEVALHGAGQTVAALAEEKGLQLVVEPLRVVAPPRVFGDAYRLHQVLLNLLSNAIKFTEHGSVRVGATVLSDTPEALTLRFWVDDTGMGIAYAQQGHIFEAFAQASTETSSRFGGTGLGLSISQELVRQMGGELQLSSAPDQGATFSFQLTLPRVGTETPAPPAQAAPTYEGLRGLRVLLAEDNLVNQWIAVVVLENRGVQVQAVGNGLDALAYLREGPFDAAILDIKMPGLSGVEVTTAVRALPNAACARIPIIALTANAFEADRIGYLAAGMNACLTKPYEEADLCQLLLQLTEKTNGAGEA